MEFETLTSSGKRLWLRLFSILSVLAIAAGGYFYFSATEAAPEVTFTNLNGEKVTAHSLRGKVVMVNFWATSCVACINEMPQLVETYNKYKDSGLELIAVAMRYDPPNYVLNYAQTRRLPFQVALDIQGELAKSFGDVKLTPTTFVIDKKGNIIKRFVGAPEPKALHRLLEKELAA